MALALNPIQTGLSSEAYKQVKTNTSICRKKRGGKDNISVWEGGVVILFRLCRRSMHHYSMLSQSVPLRSPTALLSAFFCLFIFARPCGRIPKVPLKTVPWRGETRTSDQEKTLEGTDRQSMSQPAGGYQC